MWTDSGASASRPDPAPRTIEPDPGRLVGRLTRAAQVWRPGVRVTSVRRLARGASSLTYQVDTTAGRIVAKVAPNGLEATRHRDVLRQAHVLSSLSARGEVPVPEVLFTDAGDEEVGRLFAMSFCPGEAFEPNVDDPPTPAPTTREIGGRISEAVRILARLHASRSLPDWIGEEPPVGLADEIERWDRAFATLPDEFGLDWRIRSENLRATMPSAVPTRLTHGDYRLGNLLCTGSTVAAVVDWEIWAASDGRLDVGWFLLNLGRSNPAAVREARGLPNQAEILSVYASEGGAPPEDVDWFVAAALYKFAATVGLIAKNARKRGETAGWGARIVPRLSFALDRIDELLGVA